MVPSPHFALLRRAFVVWLVGLVAVFGAIAPTLSHALVLARSGSAAWVEVCTSTGTRWVLLGQAKNSALQPADAAFSANAGSSLVAADSPDGQESAASLNHCPFCLLFGDRAAPAPNALSPRFVVTGDYEAPRVRQVFSLFTYYAFAPPPRGPPVFS